MRRPPIHPRYVPRVPAYREFPAYAAADGPGDRPDKPGNLAWASMALIGLALGAGVYFGPVGPARDSARGVDPTPTLPVFTIPHPDDRRDTWCPTPEQRAAADELPPPARLAGRPAQNPDELLGRLEAIAELLGPAEPGTPIDATEHARTVLAMLIDDLKAGRVNRP